MNNFNASVKKFMRMRIIYKNSLARRMNEVWMEKTKEYAIINTDSLLVMPKPLQRRAIQLILNYLYLERPSSLSALHIHQLLTLFLNPQP